MTEARGARAAQPDDPAKPDSPTDITKPSWTYVVRKAVREFSEDECLDIAAALTYYSVLALFPMMIALLSLVGLFGQGRRPSTRCSASSATSGRTRLRTRSSPPWSS